MAKLSPEQLALVHEYGHLFHNTGGNEVVELMEPKVLPTSAIQSLLSCRGHAGAS